MRRVTWEYTILGERRRCALIALRNNSELLGKIGCAGQAMTDAVIRTGFDLCEQVQRTDLGLVVLTLTTCGCARGGLS